MKNSPTLHLAVELTLAAFGITGFLAKFLSLIITTVLGFGLDKRIIIFDVSQDAKNQAMKDPIWRERATALWSKASAKVYTEEEKYAIEQEYLKILGDYATLADRLR